MRIILAIVIVWCLSMALAGPARAADQTPKPRRNPDLLKLPSNVWFKLHEQKPGDPVRFQQQKHGGSCVDTKRGRLILFGSNTHGRDWTNSPLIFDPVAVKWTRLYPNDPLESYRVSEQGLPVVVVDRKLEPENRDSKLVAETWLYDLAADAWTQVKPAALPFGCGMNYNMEYDPSHGCLLLVTGGYGAATTVWALRIELDKLK